MQNSTILSGRFGKRYRIHRAGATPRHVAVRRFADAESAYRFLRQLQAPQTYWARLAGESLPLYVGNQPDPLIKVSRLLIRNRLTLIELDNFTERTPVEQRSLSTQNGTVYQVATPAALLNTQAKKQKQRVRPEEVAPMLEQTNASDEQLGLWLQAANLTPAKDRQAQTRQLAQAVAEEKVVIYRQEPYTPPPVSAAEAAPASTQPVELAPAAEQGRSIKAPEQTGSSDFINTLVAASAAGKAFCEDCEDDTPPTPPPPLVPAFANGQSQADEAAEPEDEKATGAEPATEEALAEVTLEYKEPNDAPAKNVPYKARLPDGSVRSGTLDENGQAVISGIPAGSVEVEYATPVTDMEITALRNQISAVMLEIIQAEKAECSAIKTKLQKMNIAEQYWEYRKAEMRGIKNFTVGLLTFVKDVTDFSPWAIQQKAVNSAWSAWQYSDEGEFTTQFKKEFSEKNWKDVADLLGIDPRTITREDLAEAQATASFIWNDQPTRDSVLTFAKNFAKAQHLLEVVEFGSEVAAEIAFDLIITALTLGAGATVAIGSKLRHTRKLGKLGGLFKELAGKLKAKAMHKKASGATGGTVSAKMEKPGVYQEAPSNNKNAPTSSKRMSLDQRRGVPPTSLEDAAARLDSMKTEIAANGYQPKYTDTELLAQAQSGELVNERYHVRFMEAGHLEHKDTKDTPLSGALGQTLETDTGAKGAKYWSTTFDQIEDADSDPKLISAKLGLGDDYDPKKKYVMVIVDTDKSRPITNSTSIPATFKKVSEFANNELGKKFPKEFTDKVMTSEFQQYYSKHYTAALDGYLPWAGSKDTEKFMDYLVSTDLSKSEKDILIQRMEMHKIIGNNQDYLGNGVTKDMNTGKNTFGAVETLNFERKEINLKQLDESGAISIIKF